MKITDIRTRALEVPFVDPPLTGFIALEKIDLLIVEVETAGGVVGTGHLHPLGPALRTLDACVHEMLAPLLIGEDASDPAQLWRRMWDATFINGRMGITVMAMAALDMALWDAKGIEAGQPLWKLWGGRPDPLPAYGSGCYRGLGRDGMIAKAQRFVDQGFSAIKMQVAHVFTADEDVANVAAMRAALGDEIEIMVDVNQGWTPEQAVETGRRLDPFRLTWLEEPVMADDVEGYVRVAEALETPVAGGENLFLHHDFAPYYAGGHVPFLQPDVMRAGFTGLREIAERARPAGAVIAPHLFPELMTHVVASIENPSWLECMGWHDHLWVEPVLPERGFMTPPNRPGHGLRFRPELVST